ncbi:tetratricopeptide repeat protein [Streptomyces roseifaciens]
MPVRVTRSRRIERAGVNTLRALLEDHDQIVQEIDGGNDYGEDLFVMLTRDGERTGVSMAIQVKSGDKYKRANSYAIPVEGHASDWKDSLLPVYGVVFDIESRQLFWANLTEALETSEGSPTWIPVSREQELHDDSVGSFLELAHAFVEARTRGHVEEATLRVASLSETSQSTPAWFVGRNLERQAIKERLTGSTERRVLVSGMAGVGKTSLVDQVVRDPSLHAVFSGGVIVTDMYGFSANRRRMARPGAAYAPLLSALGVPTAEIPRNAEGQAALYHRTLDALSASGTPALLVFDNVAELSQVAELLPSAETHGVIVTSRSRLGVIEGIETIKLDCLEPAESEALFSNAMGPHDGPIHDPDPIREICELCGHLPLALSISAAILKEDPALSPDDLLKELAEEKSRLDVLQFGDTAVRAALQVSLARLDETLRVPFCKLAIHPGNQMSEQIAAAVLGVEAPRARSILRRLGQASLVSRAPAASRWKMHDLIYLFAAEQCPATVPKAERQAAFDRMAELYYQISHDADLMLRGTPEGNPPRFVAADDALSWFDMESANLRAAARQAQDVGMTEDAFMLSMNLVLFFDLRGRVAEALQSAQMAYEAARQERHAERQVRALNNVGLALTSQRKFENAILTLMKASAIAERTGFLEGQCEATISLGAAVRQHRGPAEAISILTEALQLARRTRDPGHIGVSLTNLGSAFRESGSFGPAAAVLAESIRYHRMSGNRRQEASAHGGLGVVLSQLGRQNQAVRCYQEAFAAYRDVQDNFGIHLNHLNLGNTQLTMGRLEEARGSLHQAHHYFRRTSNNHYEATSLALLGALEWMSENTNQARLHYEDALRLYRRLGSLEGIKSVEGSLRDMLGGPTR